MRIIIGFSLCLLICFAFVTVVSSAGIDKNTVGVWLLDEGSGVDVKDATKINANGQIKGNAKWVKGKFVNALEFGDAIYVTVPNSSALMPAKAITVEAWINFADAGIKQDMVIARIEPGFSLQKFNTDIIEGWINIGGWKGVRDIVGGEVMKPNAWYHVAFTYDGTSMKTYVNGKLDRENKLSGDIVYEKNPFTIGSYKGESYFWKGMIDEVAISSVARSADEIKADMNGFAGTSAVASVGKLASTWAQVKK
ncbi:MAG: LamG domain-containing protein [Candidatus Poribacteria bacterium]